MSYFYLSSEQGVILVVFWDTYFSIKYKVKTLIIDLFFERSKKRAVHFGMPPICGLNAVKNALVVLNLAFTAPRNSAGNN